MRLLIISHTPHYLSNGRLVGWGPTIREIDHLSRLFKEAVHIAPLHPKAAPASSLPYASNKIRYRAVPPAGGDRISDKIRILFYTYEYLRTIRQELEHADIVHVRCPANISFLAITLLSLCIQPTYRWVKYAGNWNPTGPESWSYTLQRWWLRKGLHRGIVTINGRWPDQPSHTYSFLNPSLTSQEICQAAELREPKEISRPLRLLFVGRIETPKGVGRIMRIAQALKERHIDYHLDLLGDGPERPDFEKLTQDNGLNSRVTFHGWLPRPELGEFYQKAHFFIFPSSSSEGWPKVLSEAMAYGVVPLAGAVSSIPQILSETGAGIALPPYDIDAFVKTIESMLKDPGQWKAASKAGINAAYQFTYEYYLETVKKTFHCAWGMVI